MNCIDYEALISAEMDRALPSDETARLEAHLSVCDSCRRVRDDYRVNRLLVRGMARHAAPADAYARLMATLANRPATVSTQAAAVIAPKTADVAAIAATRTWRKRVTTSAVRGLRAVASLAIVLLGVLVYLGLTDAEGPEAPAAPAATRSVTVRPRALVRGHAYQQTVSPTADRSSWHFLAIDEESVLPSGDDEDAVPEATREI